MNVLLPLPIALPLAAAAVSLALGQRMALRRALSLVATVATLAAAVVLAAQVAASGVTATQIGDWPSPFGITLVADRFSAIMLVVAAAMVLAVLVYALGQLAPEQEQLSFHPVYLVLTAGINASFLTGDLFNLFVAFEVMLTASYVLLTLGASAGQVRAGMTYIVISLVASTMFIVAVGLVYAATGTVNMADLAGRVRELDPALRQGLGLLLLVVFGVKAAIFPLFFWLPDAYPTAPAPITAIFAGLLTKVGVYAMIRSQTLMFGAIEDGPSTLLLAIAGCTMLFGVLGAIAQNDMKRILSFHIVSQIGYMVLGLGLFTLAGLAGAILYIVHHIIVKTSLFLVGGMVERTAGTASLSRLSGLIHRAPLVALLFALPALSLAGLPPFSGFVAKLALVQAGLDVDRSLVIGVSLLVSLLTLFSMTKIWAGAFWGADPAGAALVGGDSDGGAGAAAAAPVDWDSDGGAGQLSQRIPWAMTAGTAALVAASLAVALASGPLYDYSVAAAEELLSPDAYAEAVLGEQAVAGPSLPGVEGAASLPGVEGAQ